VNLVVKLKAEFAKASEGVAATALATENKELREAADLLRVRMRKSIKTRSVLEQQMAAQKSDYEDKLDKQTEEYKTEAIDMGEEMLKQEKSDIRDALEALTDVYDEKLAAANATVSQLKKESESYKNQVLALASLMANLPKKTTAVPETTTAGAEATTAGAETTTAGAETTTAGAETTTAGAETTTAGASGPSDSASGAADDTSSGPAAEGSGASGPADSSDNAASGASGPAAASGASGPATPDVPARRRFKEESVSIESAQVQEHRPFDLFNPMMLDDPAI